MIALRLHIPNFGYCLIKYTFIIEEIVQYIITLPATSDLHWLQCLRYVLDGFRMVCLENRFSIIFQNECCLLSISLF